MLSATSEYALRALAYMARAPREQAVLARNLADTIHVPANYLSKVLLALRNAGILDSTRGAGGGYRLQRDPGEVFLIDVVEIFEGRKVKPMCLLNNRECSDATPCAAHGRWRELTSAYTGFLVTTSIADIAGLARVPVASLVESAD